MTDKTAFHPGLSAFWKPNGPLKRIHLRMMGVTLIKETANTPDLLLNVSRQTVCSGLIGRVNPVGIDLISLFGKGLCAVSRRIFAQHHFPSLSIVLKQTQKYINNANKSQCLDTWWDPAVSTHAVICRCTDLKGNKMSYSGIMGSDVTLMSKMLSMPLWSMRQLATTGSSISNAWRTEGNSGWFTALKGEIKGSRAVFLEKSHTKMWFKNV